MPSRRFDRDVLSKVRALVGVLCADFLERADRDALARLATPAAAENRGIQEVFKRERAVCLFKDKHFRPPPEPTLLLVDEAGTILGREVLPEEDLHVKGGQRLAYLGKDFVLSPDVRPSGKMHFLLPPVRFPELETLKGIHGLVSGSPDPPQDDYLRQRFNVPPGRDLASILVGFDRRNP